MHPTDSGAGPDGRAVLPSELTAVVRADAGPEIGGGHVMRCLTLADALAAAGWRVSFAGAAETLESVRPLGRSGHAFIAVPAERRDDAAWLGRQCGGRAELLIVDHYRLAAPFERACRAWAGRIMVVDDLADRPHDCDVLLDQTFGRRAEDYAALAPPACIRLIGADFALVRPQFAAAREAAMRRRAAQSAVGRIFVSIGSTDPRNVTSRVLQALDALALNLEIDVAIGGSAPHLAEVAERARRAGAALHVDRADVWTLMGAADLAIGGGGTSSWERCAIGLPALVIAVAGNQRLAVENLARAGAVEAIGDGADVCKRDLMRAIARLCGDGDARQAMARAAAAICDGRGVERVRAALGKS